MIKSPSATPSLASLLSPNLHGSEDGNETIELEQALRAANNTTTESTASPMSTTCGMTEDEALLASVENVTNTFAVAGVTEETLELLVPKTCDQQTMIELMRDKSVDFVLETELKIDNGLTRTRVKIEVSKWETNSTSSKPTTYTLDK